MAATIATAIGYDRTRVKETHRLGHESALATAATWTTKASACIRADGSGYVEVRLINGGRVHYFEFGPDSSRGQVARDSQGGS